MACAAGGSSFMWKASSLWKASGNSRERAREDLPRSDPHPQRMLSAACHSSLNPDGADGRRMRIVSAHRQAALISIAKRSFRIGPRTWMQHGPAPLLETFRMTEQSTLQGALQIRAVLSFKSTAFSPSELPSIALSKARISGPTGGLCPPVRHLHAD